MTIPARTTPRPASSAVRRRILSLLPWGELIRFGATGLTSVGIYLVFLFPLRIVLPGRLWLAAAISYVASMVANYLLQRNFTFRSQRRHQEAVLRYLMVHAVATVINSGVLEFATDRLNASLLVAQGASVVCVAVWSYLAQKFWVFIGRRPLGEQAHDPNESSKRGEPDQRDLS